MKLAQYEVEVNCTKKKEGRQLAAQKILKEMHPHIQTWGSMLRLYDSKLLETFQNDEQVIQLFYYEMNPVYEKKYLGT